MKQTILLLLSLLFITSCGLIFENDYATEPDCEAFIEDYIVNFYKEAKQAIFYREKEGSIGIIADTFYVKIYENPNVIIVNDVRYVKE